MYLHQLCEIETQLTISNFKESKIKSGKRVSNGEK